MPVFLPNMGCPERCQFCDQAAQTGRNPQSLARIHDRLARDLEQAEARKEPPRDIGFYGATFTRLPGGWCDKFVKLAAEFKGRGVVAEIRCSTRPDAAGKDSLTHLSALGLDLVEFGAQSFSERILEDVKRGYGPQDIRRACRDASSAGLKFGLHLMPGLPGMAEADFARDVAESVALAPDCVRLHPCLVLAGTVLQGRYEKGGYRPWGLTRTLWSLARALNAFHAARIPVIRVGLCPEEALGAAVVAGPWHPSLGQRAAGRALFLTARRLVRQRGEIPSHLFIPRRYLSDVHGWRGEMAPAWRGLGLTKSSFSPWDEKFFLLRWP